MGKSRGYGFVYMQSIVGAQAVEEYAIKMKYRVEMYGRTNVQLPKHMKDRSKHVPHHEHTSSRDSTRSITHSVRYGTPPESRSMFSRSSPTDNTVSSGSSTQHSFYNISNPSSLIFTPQLTASQGHYLSTQTIEGSLLDYSQQPYSMNAVDFEHSLSYYYCPPPPPLFYHPAHETINIQPPSEVTYNTAYSMPMVYKMSSNSCQNDNTLPFNYSGNHILSSFASLDAHQQSSITTVLTTEIVDKEDENDNCK